MKKNHYEMDERQKQIQTQAMAWGYVFLCICLVAAMIYRFCTAETMGWEFFALLGACAVVLLARRLLGDVDQPKDIMGNPLPTGSAKADRRARRRNYAIESLIFALTSAALETLVIAFGKDSSDYELTALLFPALSRGAAIAVTALISFGIMFSISYTLDYILGERFKVRRYNEMLRAMEED